MTHLSAAQMAAVTHPVRPEPVTDDVEVVYTTSNLGSYYAMSALLDYNHPLVRTSQGYCVVYQQVDASGPGERWNGFWFGLRAQSGGGSGSGPLPSREDAVRHVRREIAGTRAFWQSWVARVGPDLTDEGERIIRCGGEHYVVGQAYRGGGFGGRRWLFRMLADGSTIDTCNLWSQGTIPTDYRDLLPDNAEQLPDPDAGRFAAALRDLL